MSFRATESLAIDCGTDLPHGKFQKNLENGRTAGKTLHEGKNGMYLAAQLEKPQKILKFPCYENCEVLS